MGVIPYDKELACSQEMVSPMDIPEISLHAITGDEHPQTLRVLGNLGNEKVLVLIDTGSTHNFIAQDVVTKFGLPVNLSKLFQVMVANREKIDCNGQCQALTLVIQGQPVTTDYYILPVSACPLVLGVQWLETLGTIEMDFKSLTMSYKKHGNTYTLQGLKRADIGALTDKEFHGLQGVELFRQINPSYPSNKSSQFKSVKHRVDGIDKENFTYSYSIIEGYALIMDILESIFYEIKTVFSPDGGSICKNTSKYHTKGDAKITEEKIKSGKEKDSGMFQAV